MPVRLRSANSILSQSAVRALTGFAIAAGIGTMACWRVIPSRPCG